MLGTKIIVDRNEATDLYDDINDLNGHTLANLTYVVPCPSWSDHPAVTNEGTANGNGPTWVGFIASEVGKSHHWTDGDTAIIVVWDDWGGWYKAVPPVIASPDPYSRTNKDPYEYGYRVPMLVISPYAKAGYVSHKFRSTAAILDFIEHSFGVAEGSLGTLDARPENDDLYADMFDFTQSPLPPPVESEGPFPNQSCSNPLDIVEDY